MKCPYCSSDSNKVIDKRETGEGSSTRRRRECLKCKKRFTTYERIETSNILVIKRNGNREQFDRQKLEKGILKSCEKRPITYEKLKKVVDSIESEIKSKGVSEVKSTTIGNIIMKKLRKLDKVAYIRFASVYRDFTDLDSFKQELEKLLKKK